MQSGKDTKRAKENGEKHPPVKRMRRKHRNSKNGCAKCKQRKIKCDENLPTCINCAKKNIECPYLTITPFQIHMIMKAHSAQSGDSSPLFNNKSNTYSEYPSRHSINLQKSFPSDASSTSDINDLKAIDTSSDKTSILQLNLKLGESAMNESVYQATDMEHILLEHKTPRETIDQKIFRPSPKYTPLKSNFLVTDISNKSEPQFDEFTSNDHNIHNIDNLKGLSKKSKIIFKSFKINRTHEYSSRQPLFEKTLDITIALDSMDFPGLFMKYGMFNLDSELEKNFFRALVMAAPFSKLTAKSLLLYSTDFIKNIILKQPILFQDRFNIKMGISCACENYSVNEIGIIANVISTEYIPKYHLFDINLVKLLVGAFVVLNYCLVYHFKSGLSIDISIEEGKKCVSKFGIFNAGLYSITMDKNKSIQKTKAVDVLAKHLIWNLKTMLKPSLRFECIEDLKKKIDKLNTKIQSDSKYFIHYENLKFFLDEHVPILKDHTTNSDTFLGVGDDDGYVIRLMNEFYQIIPFDLNNLLPGQLTSDEMIVIYLSYITTGNLLTNILPGVLSFAVNDFSGRGWHVFLVNNVEVLMMLFKQVSNNEYKEVVMYLIRSITILKSRETHYTKFFASTNFDELTNPDLGIDIFERCRRLKHIKHMGILSETLMKSFKFDGGGFYEKWNVPHLLESISISNTATSSRINNVLPTLEDKIADFLESNNGLFTRDYQDPEERMGKKVSIAVDSRIETPDSIAMAWRVAAHIHMNNT